MPDILSHRLCVKFGSAMAHGTTKCRYQVIRCWMPSACSIAELIVLVQHLMFTNAVALRKYSTSKLSRQQ